VVVEEAQEASDVVIHLFLVNDTSTVVLFDSGVSHSFISATYVGKNNLPLALLSCQMIVSSPGGDMPTRQLCPKVNLKKRGVDFVANLIVLESKGIDVILGMDWLSKHKVLIDCAKKSVDPSKVQDVLSWNAHTSVGDIQSFLRLAGYYQKFIEGFSKISKPMTELLEKDKKFEWTSTCEASF
jgi:hypothetical protein